MSVGGARPGAGRPAGSINRRHSEVLAGALAQGDTPIEYMLKVMRDETEGGDEKRRDWAAQQLAPYLHPRPAPLERTVEIELPETSTVDGINAALDRIIQAIGKGELSPAEGQSFMSVIETRRKAIETGDMLARIEALEKQTTR